MTSTRHHDRREGCDTCAIARHASSRRQFLQQAGLLAAALMLAPSAAAAGADAPADARPLPPSARDRASERRYPVPAVDSIQVDKDNSVMIARAGGRVYAFSLACPHQNTALRWDAGEHEFRCPKHKSRYRPDGTFIDGRATRAMDRLAIRRDGDAIVADVDTLYQEDEQRAAWAGAFVQV